MGAQAKRIMFVGIVWKMHTWFWKFFKISNKMRIASFLYNGNIHIGFYRIDNREDSERVYVHAEVGYPNRDGLVFLIKQFQHTLDTYDTFHKEGEQHAEAKQEEGYDGKSGRPVHRGR